MQVYHTHPVVDDRAAALAALYRACLRRLMASR